MITQMAGTAPIAYGVVFVLLLGEIDLSIAFVSGVAGVVVAELQLPDGANLPRLVCDHRWRSLAAPRSALFQGSFVAFVGVPSFVVTLAGYSIWQGVIQKAASQGVIVIQDKTINNFANYLFATTAGWIMAAVVSVALRRRDARRGVLEQPARHPRRDPLVLVAARSSVVPAIAFVTSGA